MVGPLSFSRHAVCRVYALFFFRSAGFICSWGSSLFASSPIVVGRDCLVAPFCVSFSRRDVRSFSRLLSSFPFLVGFNVYYISALWLVPSLVIPS